MGSCGGKHQRDDDDIGKGMQPNTCQMNPALSNKNQHNNDLNDGVIRHPANPKIKEPHKTIDSKMSLERQAEIVPHTHDIGQYSFNPSPPTTQSVTNKNHDFCSPLFCDSIYKEMLPNPSSKESILSINNMMIQTINRRIVSYYSCWSLRNLFPSKKDPIKEIDSIILLYLMKICPDGVLPTLQFDNKECLNLMVDFTVDRDSVQILLRNYPQINYRIFYKPRDEMKGEWKHQDIDNESTFSPHTTTTSSSNCEFMSQQTDWKSLSRLSAYSMPQICTIKGLKINTSYQVCIAPKFTEKLRKGTTSAITISSTLLEETESTKEVKVEFIDKKDEERKVIYGIAGKIELFRTTNWRFDAGTTATKIDGVIFDHKSNCVDTVGCLTGYDKGVHEFKIEFQDRIDNGGMNYCAFGIVSHHFFNNAMSALDWISGHDKNYYYLTEYGYLCRKDDDFIDTEIKWRDESDEDEQVEFRRTKLSMILDLNNWTLTYIIGIKQIDTISIGENQTYYPCVSGRKGTFIVKILSH